MGIFAAIGCALGLWGLHKWDLRDTSYYKSQKRLMDEFEIKADILKQQLAAGIITQDEHDELRKKFFDEKNEQSFINTIRETQVGFKNYKG